MSRILCIDYGKKRCGIAVTDPLKIIATALCTVESSSLIYWLKQYLNTETVEKVLIGYPLALDNTPTDATPLVDKFIRNFTKVFPLMPIEKVDEQFTSKQASASMLAMGMSKKSRQDKAQIDQISAALMLQEYLEQYSREN